MKTIHLGKFEDLDISFNIENGISIYNRILYRAWRHNNRDFYYQLNLIKTSNLKYLCLYNTFWYFRGNPGEDVAFKYDAKTFKEFILNNKDIIEIDLMIDILE